MVREHWFKRMWELPVGSFLQHYHDNDARYVYAGLLAAVAFPAFYVLYVYVTPQDYENLPFRLVGMVLGMLVAVKRYWPQAILKYHPLATYLLILFALPFFHSFMVCKNEGSVTYIVDSMMALTFLILALDNLNVLIGLFVAIPLGVLAYFLSTTDPVFPVAVIERIPAFILLLVGGMLFNYTSRIIEEKRVLEEKVKALTAAMSNIAHEVRTPLLAIKGAASGVADYIPTLLEAHDRAVEAGVVSNRIPSKVKKMIAVSLEDMQSIVDRVNSVISLLLVNLRGKSVDNRGFEFCVASDCVTEALDTYPFMKGERDRVSVSIRQDFRFYGSDLLFTHVLFNLLKNALLAIIRADKGDIQIVVQGGGAWNEIHVVDSGSGISGELLPHIFEQFVSSSSSGAGVGLAFCREVMDGFEGRIECESEEGVFSDFVLKFPIRSEGMAVDDPGGEQK